VTSSKFLLFNLKKLVKACFRLTGVVFLPFKKFEELKVRVRSQAEIIDQNQRDFEFLQRIEPNSLELCLKWMPRSRAQLRQDLFVLVQTNFKSGGFFVEFGATDGIALSNTYLLEESFHWRGILAEPGRVWLAQLQKNRPNSSIETACVWRDSSSTLVFREANMPELSSIDQFHNLDRHSVEREKYREYNVNTIQLNDLLRKHHAPKKIDFLSIDTEGSEYEILSAFDFEEYSFSVIAVEHNYNKRRDDIHSLLTSKGYSRVHPEISYWDDWYTLD
jgi:FkbM family methyltransferase